MHDGPHSTPAAKLRKAISTLPRPGRDSTRTAAAGGGGGSMPVAAPVRAPRYRRSWDDDKLSVYACRRQMYASSSELEASVDWFGSCATTACVNTSAGMCVHAIYAQAINRCCNVLMIIHKPYVDGGVNLAGDPGRAGCGQSCGTWNIASAHTKAAVGCMHWLSKINLPPMRRIWLQSRNIPTMLPPTNNPRPLPRLRFPCWHTFTTM